MFPSSALQVLRIVLTTDSLATLGPDSVSPIILQATRNLLASRRAAGSVEEPTLSTPRDSRSQRNGRYGLLSFIVITLLKLVTYSLSSTQRSHSRGPRHSPNPGLLSQRLFPQEGAFRPEDRKDLARLRCYSLCRARGARRFADRVLYLPVRILILAESPLSIRRLSQ